MVDKRPQGELEKFQIGKKKDWQGLITQFANGQFFSLSSLVNKMKMYIFCPSFQYVLALSNSRLPYSFNGSYS